MSNYLLSECHSYGRLLYWNIYHEPTYNIKQLAHIVLRYNTRAQCSTRFENPHKQSYGTSFARTH